MPRPLSAAFVLVPLICLLAAPSASAQRRRDSVARAATVQTQLTATGAQVHEALMQALSTWKMRKTSAEEGIVKTEWDERARGDATYRGRIVAEFAVEGYTVLLSVKHERQLKQSEMRPTIGGPAASWMDVDGDFAVAQAVVRSVEEALGHEPDELKIGERDRGSSRPVETWNCIVSPTSAGRIADLRTRRRGLVDEVRAMDKQILAAVYAGQVEQVQADLERVKARKAAMEGQITAIDREILELVLAD